MMMIRSSGRAIRGLLRDWRRHLSAPLAVLLVLTSSAPLSARVNIKPGYNSFSPEQDVELGREAAREAERQLNIVTDPQLNEYISRLGQRLANHAPGAKFPYTFKLVNSKDLNAFALPGGPVYIHTAIISAAANEAQLAGVLAHEISHVALRHSTNQVSKAMLAQAPLAILGGVFSGGGIGGQLAQLGIGFGLQSTFLKFSRSAEKQADEQGAQILYDAGYDPKAMADFFTTLERSGGGRGGPEFFASHPNPGNRQRDVAQLIASLGPARQFTSDSQEFAAVKARIGGLPAMPARNAGDIRRNDNGSRPSLPSRRLRSLNTEAFSIQYPDNWDVYGENTSTVTLVPPEGVIQVGQSPALAYGAIVSIFEPTPEPGRRLSLEAATSQLVRDLQRSNPDLRVSSRPRTLRGPGGEQMMSVSATGRSPLGGQDEADLIVTTFRPEGLWYVVFIAPESEYQSWEPSFQQMLSSVRFPR